MTHGIAATGQMTLGITSIGQEESRFARILSSAGPLTLGLLLPVLAIVLIEPASLRHARFITIFVLLPLFVMALCAYFFAVLSPGEIVGVTLDADRRRLELVQANILSTRQTELPFASADRFRLMRHYDDDGYATDSVTLELRDGRVLRMPAGITPDQVRAMNLLIGLGER